jgi:uncharacterized protein (TIGR03067 family)
MRIPLATVLAILFMEASTALHAGGAKKDAQLILGPWSMVAGEKAGKKAPEDVLRNFHMTFEAEGKFKVRVKDEDHAGTYTLNATKKPKEIDFSVDNKDLSGIYLLEGDTLKICFGEGSRPTEFATQEDTKTMLLVLKRDKK